MEAVFCINLKNKLVIACLPRVYQLHYNNSSSFSIRDNVHIISFLTFQLGRSFITPFLIETADNIKHE